MNKWGRNVLEDYIKRKAVAVGNIYEKEIGGGIKTKEGEPVLWLLNPSELAAILTRDMMRDLH